MFRGKYIVFFIVLASLWSCQREPDIQLAIHECAAMPAGRASCACFVFGDQAYVFGGRDAEGNHLNDLWRYTPATDTWENLGSTPLMQRVNPTACVHGDKVYIGLGFHGKHGQDSCYLRDWWEYIPATDQWTRLADYPNHYTDRATSFAGENELYVGYGFSWNYRRDMFRYSIADNRWDSIDVGVSFHGYPTRSFGGIGCTCQGRHFMGTGFFRNSLNWWAEFLPEGRWEKRAEVPGRKRTLAATSATDQFVYLCGGVHYGGVNTTGEVLQDIRRYDPQKDQWLWVGMLPTPLINHICFAIGGRVYFGLGEDDDLAMHNQLYYIEE